MATQLEAHNLPLEKVFSSDYEFEIPRFQRPYAWTTDNANQLLTDLEEALMDAQDDPYFLGSIVLVKQGKRSQVIDGQQRLTTLTILLALLRDLATDDKLKAGIQNYIADTSKSWKPNAQPRNRLQIRVKDRDFFADHVQKEGATSALVSLSDNIADTEPRRAIRDNAKALREELTTWTGSKCTELFEMLIERTFLVVVSTPDEQSAYRIFGVLNARGLLLSPTDIFKNRVIGDLPDYLQDKYADTWDQYQDLLGGDNFTELFRDVRTVVAKKRSEQELLKEFDAEVLENYLPGNAAQFVDHQLVPYAAAFLRVVNQDFTINDPAWAMVNEWLRRLDRLDNRDWRPAALWALTTNEDDPTFLASFLRKLERLAVSSMLRGEYTTPRVGRYIELLKQLEENALDAPAFELSDEEKKDSRKALDGEVYKFRPPRRKLILQRLEDLLAAATGVKYDHKVISIEHVLPQNPKADSQWLADFTADEREQWTHRLGNLLLLNKATNSSANAADFAIKKGKYFQVKGGGTNFVLTTQVINEPVWTPGVVERRQEELTKKLFDEWGLN